MAFTPSVKSIGDRRDTYGSALASTSARPVPTYVLARALAQSVAESMTIPANAAYVVLSTNTEAYVNLNATATVPGDTTDGSAAEQLPANSKVTFKLDTSVSAISVITPTAAGGIVTATFYSA